jgi:hypothetical protein
MTITRAEAMRRFGLTDRELKTLTLHQEAHPYDRGRGIYKPDKFYVEQDVIELAQTPAVRERLAKKAANPNRKPAEPKYLPYAIAKEKYGLTDVELKSIYMFLQVLGVD